MNPTHRSDRLSKLGLLLLLCASVLISAGCKPETNQSVSAVKIGAIYPLSGSLESTGQDIRDYVLSREVWALDLAETRPPIRQVNDLYRERCGRNMTSTSARAFTGMVVLADAINRAGSIEPEAIRKALRDTNVPANHLIMPWDGVKFNPNTGQNTMAQGLIVQIQDQNYVTVWPWNLATHELIWPMPGWPEND